MSFPQYNYQNPFNNFNEFQNYLRNNKDIDNNDSYKLFGQIHKDYHTNINDINDFNAPKINLYEENYNVRLNYNRFNYPGNVSQDNQKFNYKNNINNRIANKAQTNFNANKMNLYKDNKIIDETNKSEPNLDLEKQILKLLIYIYSYEKELSQKNIFNDDEKNYLINSSWLLNFKKLNSYDNFKRNLDYLYRTFDYINKDFPIDNLINNYLIKFPIEYKPFENLGKINTDLNVIKPKYIKFTTPGELIPSKIMNIISSNF